MDLDPVFLSRVQFAWVIAWHILLPAFTVGWPAFIAVLEGLNFFTGRQVYLRISMFWIKIFSISFGMGVVTGIVMPFQFGTNWSRYGGRHRECPVAAFAYEGLTAFFSRRVSVRAAFGRKLVPSWAHFVAALMVSLGTLFSSFWILVGQQLDADAGRLRDHRRTLLPDGLAASRSSILHFPPGSRTRWWRFSSPRASS